MPSVAFQSGAGAFEAPAGVGEALLKVDRAEWRTSFILGGLNCKGQKREMCELQEIQERVL